MPFDASLRNTLIFLAIFIVAFFPNAFHFITSSILSPFSFLSGNDEWRSPAAITLPTCNCCPSANCYKDILNAANSQKTKSQDKATQPALNNDNIGNSIGTMSWFQKQFALPSRSRGSYLITDHVIKELPEIRDYKVGILHLFVQHTSCGLTLNENWDEDVREDMSDALDRLAPEDRKGDLYRHSAEGLDDMPAHIKSALVGASVTIPISNGKLNTGTWQGIWYLEFRTSKHARRVVATIQGERR